jgi:hypothetical protein
MGDTFEDKVGDCPRKNLFVQIRNVAGLLRHHHMRNCIPNYNGAALYRVGN